MSGASAPSIAAVSHLPPARASLPLLHRSALVASCAALFAALVTAAGCSSSEPANATTTGIPAATDDGDAGDEAPATTADAGSTGVKEEGLCGPGAACAPGLTCLAMNHDGLCAKACKTSSDCRSYQKCTETGGGSYCLARCDLSAGQGCGRDFACYGDVCLASCTGKPGACPSDMVCDSLGLCEDAPPAPAPLSCTGPVTATTSGITGTRTLGSLSTTEKEAFCDYTACGWGAYGASKACTTDGGTFSVAGPKSREECATSTTFTKCSSLTVSAMETCTNKMNGDPCNALCIATTDPACDAVRSCLK